MKARKVQDQSVAFRDYLLTRMEKKGFSGAVLVGKPVNEGGSLFVGAPRCTGSQIDEVAGALVSMSVDLLLNNYPPDVIHDLVGAYASKRLMQLHRRSEQASNVTALGALLSGGEVLGDGVVGMPLVDGEGD